MKFVYINDLYVEVDFIKSVRVGVTGYGPLDYPYILIEYLDGSKESTSFEMGTEVEEVKKYLSQVIESIDKGE